MKRYIKKFSELSAADIAQAGIKGAFLADLYNLNGPDLKVPDGFVLTSQALDYFIQYNDLADQISALTKNIAITDTKGAEEISGAAKRLLFNAKFPVKLEVAITRACEAAFGRDSQPVAVRSSLQYYVKGNGPDSFLNISGQVAIIYAIKCCFASYFNADAITHHKENGITGFSLSVIVQKMVNAENGSSGTACSSNPQNATANSGIYIEGNHGLGGQHLTGVTPDKFVIDKVMMHSHNAGSITRRLGSKTQMLVCNDNAAGTNTVTLKLTPGELRDVFILNDAEALLIAKAVMKAAGHYNSEICLDWAKDGTDDTLYITGLRVLQV